MIIVLAIGYVLWHCLLPWPRVTVVTTAPTTAAAAAASSVITSTIVLLLFLFCCYFTKTMTRTRNIVILPLAILGPALLLLLSSLAHSDA